MIRSCNIVIYYRLIIPTLRTCCLGKRQWLVKRWCWRLRWKVIWWTSWTAEGFESWWQNYKLCMGRVKKIGPTSTFVLVMYCSAKSWPWVVGGERCGGSRHVGSRGRRSPRRHHQRCLQSTFPVFIELVAGKDFAQMDDGDVFEV